MATTKRIVCLANSRKLNGRCVAGREVLDGDPGPWVRPVSDREHQEVSEYERQYEDGSHPSVLDVIDIPLSGPAPGTYQQENWRLDSGYYWVRRGRLAWEELESPSTSTTRSAASTWPRHPNPSGRRRASDNRVFFVRMNNSTRALPDDECAAYCAEHWRDS